MSLYMRIQSHYRSISEPDKKRNRIYILPERQRIGNEEKFVMYCVADLRDERNL